MDLALDDFIKTKKKEFQPRKSGPGLKGKFGKRQVTVFKGVRGGRVGDIRTRLNQRLNARLRTQDARQVLAANKRSKVTDARQLLSNKVKNDKPVEFILPTKIIKNDKFYQQQSQQVKVVYDPPNEGYPMITKQIDRPTVRRAPAAERPLVRRPPQFLDRQDIRRAPVMVPFEEPVDLPRGRSRSPPPIRRRPQPPPQPPPAPIIQGFKVTISNLHPGVSREDIYELFSSVGPVKKCVLQRPGDAEVVYASKEDALAAVRRYDRRELDGMAMRLKVTTVGIKASSGHQGQSNIEVNPHAVHAALFNRGSNASRRPVNFKVSI